MKRTTALLPGLLTALLLSACGSGVASGSGAGVAARVGDEVITVEELRDSVTRALEVPTIAAQAAADQAAFQRGVLGRLILAEVYDAAARDLEVVVTDKEVADNVAQIEQRLGGRDQLLQAAASQGIVEEEIAPFVRSGMLNEAVSAALVADVEVTDAQLQAAYDANRTRYELAEAAHILVDTEAKARAVLARVRAGEDFATLARTFSIDPGSKDAGGNLGKNPRGTFFAPFEEAVFAAKVGEVVGPVQTEAGFHLIRVISRESRTFAQVRDELATEIRNSGQDVARQEFFTTLSADLDIRVNPRFGRWDSASAAVVAASDSLSSPEPVPGAPVQPGLPEIGGAPGQPQDQPPAPAQG